MAGKALKGQVYPKPLNNMPRPWKSEPKERLEILQEKGWFVDDYPSPNKNQNTRVILFDLYGMVTWPLQRLSDLRLGNQKVSMNHMVTCFKVFESLQGCIGVWKAIGNMLQIPLVAHPQIESYQPHGK